MHFSKHNIFSKIKESENFFIVNLLTGNADILSDEEAEKVTKVKNNEVVVDEQFVKELQEKGYLANELEENKLFRRKYLDFVDSRDDDEIQLFFVPNYSCNFACIKASCNGLVCNINTEFIIRSRSGACDTQISGYIR